MALPVHYIAFSDAVETDIESIFALGTEKPPIIKISGIPSHIFLTVLSIADMDLHANRKAPPLSHLFESILCQIHPYKHS